MKSSELRKQFLNYFKRNGHTLVDTSPLIPMGDPSLLFTTAGMVQFKPMFAGEVETGYTRATSCQKCFRTTDLENVGQTPRHHTFFEMLGNFSFGDYFKKEAIEFAWDFSTEIIKLDPKRIYVSIYQDDDEAYDLWTKHMDFPKERMVRLGKEDNFWGPAGESGACGPCSELYYDLGEDLLRPGDSPLVGGENNRYIEYWNLVFNQYNQQLNGDLLPLPKTGIDTGLGLERLTMISQEVQSVYETDIFKPTIDQIVKISNVPYNETSAASINVISDHLRGVCFLLAENILPSNEGRGYVIRRILRRAIRFSRFIGLNEPFISRLVPTMVDVMGSTYPELVKQSEKLQKIIASEEEIFFSTLAEGSTYLENLISGYMEEGKKVVSGEEAFKLYDSMGFPMDLTREIASEKGLSVDIDTFDQLMDQQKKRGRSRIKNAEDNLSPLLDKLKVKTVYCGEEQNECDSQIVSLLKKDGENRFHEIDHCSEKDEVIVITEKTPFYGNSGGQVGDQGIIKKQKNQIQVTDTQIVKGITLHYATVQKGSFKKNDLITLSVDDTMKMSTARNHSATHLLQFALQNILGDHVRQLGSLVNDGKLRFDFSHFHAMTHDEIIKVEKAVNHMIRQNTKTQIEVMDKNKALKEGAMAFFGDKYDQSVRTVQIGESFELCGGSHIKQSGDIGCFKIISESSISSGTRRIEAVTGEKAIELYSDLFNLSKKLELTLNTSFLGLEERVASLLEKNKLLEKEIKQFKAQSVVSNIGEMIKTGLSQFGDVHYVGLSLKDKDINELRKINDQIKSKYQKLVTVILSEKEDKIFYISSVSKDLAQKTIKANDIVQKLSEWLDGKGGGKEQMAQGTSSSSSNIPETLNKLKTYIQSFF